jgi:hypothetical protein
MKEEARLERRSGSVITLITSSAIGIISIGLESTSTKIHWTINALIYRANAPLTHRNPFSAFHFPPGPLTQFAVFCPKRVIRRRSYEKNQEMSILIIPEKLHALVGQLG